MSITIKKPEDIEKLRECGKRHSFIIKTLVDFVKPGISTKDLDDLANKLIKENGDKSAFLGYKPYGAKRAFPASLCVSINDEVVHGIPNEDSKILKEGDIVSIDLGLSHKGMITDGAVTVPVGKIDGIAKKLIEATKNALEKGIEQAGPGKTTGDIGFAIQSFSEKTGFCIVEELAGHGVGYSVHEEPFVPNYGFKGEGEELLPGMVIAIEPMLNEGTSRIKLLKDGYTYKTEDGKRSAHFEHTVLITETGREVLTR